MKPITLTQVLDQGDVLDVNRQALYFAPINGNGNRILTEELAIRGQGFTPPAANLGQIRFFLFGHPVNFAGARDNGGRFNISFFETNDGASSASLYAWMQIARHPLHDTSQRKILYSTDAVAEQYDTTGRIVFKYLLGGVFPLTVSPPPQSDQSGAYRIDATFSFDTCDPLVENYYSIDGVA